MQTTTRRQRRAYMAERKREERRELEHDCACARSARAAGVDPKLDLGVSILFFHDLHKALGERACPKCPECTALRREGALDRPAQPREVTLSYWRDALERKIRGVP